jgi:hypothetical protein
MRTIANPTVADSETTTAARHTLDNAIQEYMGVVNGEPAIVIDWYLGAEVHTESSGRVIQVTDSPTMTPWKREGFLRHIARAFGISS